MFLRRLSKQFSESTCCRNQFFLKRSAPQDVGNSLRFQSIATQSAKPTARQNLAAGNFGDQVFAPSYSIFKGKTALSTKPVLPQFSKSDSGRLKLDRRGSIMFTFWPAVGERKYNWEKKQIFALSATEVGSIINLGPHDSVEFFHDPSMLSSNAGQVRKSLSIKPQSEVGPKPQTEGGIKSKTEGGNGYLFTLSVTNNILKTNERFIIPVTPAEFQVMRTAFSFALPHILGWYQYANQPPQSLSSQPLGSSLLMESEWDK